MCQLRFSWCIQSNVSRFVRSRKCGHGMCYDCMRESYLHSEHRRNSITLEPLRSLFREDNNNDNKNNNSSNNNNDDDHDRDERTVVSLSTNPASSTTVRETFNVTCRLCLKSSVFGRTFVRGTFVASSLTDCVVRESIDCHVAYQFGEYTDTLVNVSKWNNRNDARYNGKVVSIIAHPRVTNCFKSVPLFNPNTVVAKCTLIVRNNEVSVELAKTYDRDRCASSDLDLFVRHIFSRLCDEARRVINVRCNDGKVNNDTSSRNDSEATNRSTFDRERVVFKVNATTSRFDPRTNYMGTDVFCSIRVSTRRNRKILSSVYNVIRNVVKYNSVHSEYIDNLKRFVAHMNNVTDCEFACDITHRGNIRNAGTKSTDRRETSFNVTSVYHASECAANVWRCVTFADNRYALPLR